MNYMLCRNSVRDYRRWRRVFDSHGDAHRAAGLGLAGLWRPVGGPKDVFFLFEVRDMRRARAFIEAPAAHKAGAASGVIEGEYHPVKDAGTVSYRRRG
ncbi:MAG TPA: hypothetical protein VKG78_06335 [Opitutaceae bacterium]|nr:hypothetical protein [Opitutaceae bacterium]